MEDSPIPVGAQPEPGSPSAQHCRRAEELWEKGDAAGAAAEWKNALNLKPDLLEERISLGIAYFQLGRRKEALGQVRLALAIQPECERAHHSLGQFYYQMGRPEEAIREYQTALSMRQDEALLYADLGDAYYALEEYEKAAEAYGRAARLEEGDAYVHFWLGWSLEKTDKIQEAAAAFWGAASADPAWGEALYALGMCFSRLGENEKALQALKRAVECLAEDEEECRAWSFCELGHVLRELGRSEEALEACKEALAIDPTNSAACLNLGLACWDLEQREEAFRQFEIVRTLEPDDPSIRRELGDAYYSIEEYARALEEYQEAVRLDPAEGDARVGRGMCFYAQEKFEEAIGEYQVAEQLGAKHPWTKFNLASAHEALGRHDEAEKHYRASLDLMPEDIESLCGLSRSLLFQEKDFEDALSAARRAVSLKDSDPQCWDTLARALCAFGRYPEALESCNKASALEPENADYLLHTGFCYEGLGMLERARSCYEKVLHLEPDHEEAQDALQRVEELLR